MEKKVHTDYNNKKAVGVTVVEKKLKIALISIAYLIAVGIALSDPQFVGKNKEIYNTIIAVAGLTVSFIQFLYSNSEHIFIWLNKVKVKAFNPGLSWELSATMEFEGDFSIDLNRIYNKIYSNSKQKEFTFGSLDLSKKFINNKHLNFKAGTSNYGITLLNGNTIILSSDSELNYRESKRKILSDFEKMIASIQSSVAKEECLTYSLKVNFKKGNPFYGLYVKSLENKYKKTNFVLNFSIENASVVVDNKSLEITTTRKDILMDVADDYLVLSDFK